MVILSVALARLEWIGTGLASDIVLQSNLVVAGKAFDQESIRRIGP